ncbi:late control protein [Tenacibaculum maritimum]|nr:late control protein [Tenacibaculum maritimum]MDB0601071.1 late control protein [Tenacibaculum maritimum]MDB0612151.1 late control protein [Tenacibaculum maritimum]
MFVLDCTITIGDYTFKQVHAVRIVKSVDLLSDTAIIKLPASALFGNENNGFKRKRLESEIQAGMPVTIKLAYKDVFEKTEFTGFVAFVKPNTPVVVIECEDSVYKIRKKRINKNFGKTTLKEVLSYVVQGTNVPLSGTIPEVNFNKFLIKNKNGAQTLQKIMDEYGLSIFIDDENKLYAGLRQTKGAGKKVSYNLHSNIIKHDLTYRRSEDIRLHVKVIGIKKDNTKVEVIVGETDGEQRTLYKYNVSDKKTLKAIGEAEISDLKFTGYRGAVTSFFVPYATRGMSAEIIDNNYPERSGTYFIPKVTISFGQNGARRKVELGNKLN